MDSQLDCKMGNIYESGNICVERKTDSKTFVVVSFDRHQQILISFDIAPVVAGNRYYPAT